MYSGLQNSYASYAETFKFAQALEGRLGILLDDKVWARFVFSLVYPVLERFQGKNYSENPTLSKAAFLHAFPRDQVTHPIVQIVRQK